MHRFTELQEGIAGSVREILGHLDAVTEEDPWIHLPRDYRLNHLADVVEPMTTLALTRSADAELCRDMLHLAAARGEKRLEQGYPDSLIFQEFPMLRQALWRYIRRFHDGNHDPRSFEAMVRIDAALALATKASLRGFHRPVFEARGRWPETIDELATEWKPLPDV